MLEYSLFNGVGKERKNACLKYANLAHNLYFDGDTPSSRKLLTNKVQFIEYSRLFLESMEGYLKNKYNVDSIKEAANIVFKDNPYKKEYMVTEFTYVKKRIQIVSRKPSLINEKTIFTLEHTARFMEFVLPYVFNCKGIIDDKHSKFSKYYRELISEEFNFFRYQKGLGDQYYDAFYECALRAQRSINSYAFFKKEIDRYELNNPKIDYFFTYYGGIDYYSNLMFSRIAAEQFLKFCSTIYQGFWEAAARLLNETSERYRKQFIANKDPNCRSLKFYHRITALLNIGAIDELIANELTLLNARGNNIAHKSISSVFSSCYHNLELLNYLKHFCLGGSDLGDIY